MTGLSYNSGEWSEVYALFKILNDSKLHSGNSDLELDLSDSVDVIHAKKKSRKHSQNIFYVPDNQCNSISIFKTLEDKEPLNTISKEVILDKAIEMFKVLQNRPRSKKGAFVIDFISDFLKNQMEDPFVKANSSSSTDIDLRVFDENAFKKIRDAGYSIKSELGGDPTVLNTSGSTGIIYEIENFHTLSNQDIDEINSIVGTVQKPNGNYKADVSRRVQTLYKKGCSLKFKKTQKESFQVNLEGIDSSLPLIYSQLLIDHFLLNGKKPLSEMILDSYGNNKLNYTLSNEGDNPYERKIKKLLSAVWRGMTGGKIWKNQAEVDGGFIFVKTTGDLACYHIFNWNNFEEYLYNHARLDTPSADRHKFGKIEKDGTFKLNCSIRHKF
jgi:type II restriction enzyme